MWFRVVGNIRFSILTISFLIINSNAFKVQAESDLDPEDANFERTMRSVDFEKLQEDLEEEQQKRAPQLSINADLHSLADHVMNQGSAGSAASLYRLGKRAPSLSVNQDSMLLADSMRGDKTETSMGLLHRSVILI